jgi:SAM-dependent methyltransferase
MVLLRNKKIRSYTKWLVNLVVIFQSLLTWPRQTEYKKFADYLFHNQKQAKQPSIGERSVEYPWVYQRTQDIIGGIVLDVGAKEGLPITDLILLNNQVYSIDPNISNLTQRGNLLLFKEDIRSTSFSSNFFDAVIVVSTLEHIGVCGRYGVIQSDDDGDINAMREIYRILKPGGRCLVTIPYGSGRSLPLNRLYNANRLKQLLERFLVIELQFFRYNEKYELWLNVPEEIASASSWDSDPWYSLACVNLVKPVEPA